MYNFKTKLKIFYIFLFSLFILNYSLLVVPTKAHCPLCVAGAAAGITLTRWIGVDDSITGVWIGALLVAMSFWFSSWLLSKSGKLRKWQYREFLKPTISLLVFTTTLWSFYQFKLIVRMSQIFGLDKLTFGMLAGGVLFYIVDLVKIKHHFPYQKIAVSLGSMAILSLIIYVLINYYI